jgi:hypothetical protein
MVHFKNYRTNHEIFAHFESLSAIWPVVMETLCKMSLDVIRQSGKIPRLCQLQETTGNLLTQQPSVTDRERVASRF